MLKKKAIYISTGLMAVCAIAYTILLAVSPLPLSYIDRNRSGIVSIEEALNTIDIGEREIKGQPDCVEFFWLKDGLTAYVRCPDKNKQTR